MESTITTAHGRQTLDRASPVSKTRRRSPHLVRNIAVGVVVLGVIPAILSVTVFNRAGRAGAMTVSHHAVTPRSFNVVIKEKGELKAARSTDIKSEVEGRCTIIWLIPEGSPVKQGDLLVELASDKIDERIQQEELKETNALTAYESAKTELEIQQDRNRSDIRKAELEIELKRLALDRYIKGDWEQQLKDAQIAIDQARIRLDRAREDHEASEKLYEKNYVTKTQRDEDHFNYLKAQWDLEKAEQALEVLKTYTHVVDLRTHESNLDEAIKEAERVAKSAAAEENKKLRALEGAEKELALTREQLAKLRSQKIKTRIIAPTQGFVVYGDGGSGGGGRWMSNDQQIKEGAEVYERQILMQLPDTAEMMVVVRIHEAKTDRLMLGQPVNVTIEGFPGRQFTGKVTKIAAVADSQNRWLNPDLKEYETQIKLDPTDAELKPGVTAYAEIMVGAVQDSLAVPLPSIFSKGGRRYVAKQVGKEVRPTEVKTGAVSTEWAEIKEGLQEGDRILLAFSDEFKRMIPDAPGGERRGPPGVAEQQADASSQNSGPNASGSPNGPRRPEGEGRRMRRSESSVQGSPTAGAVPAASSAAPAPPAKQGT